MLAPLELSPTVATECLLTGDDCNAPKDHFWHVAAPALARWSVWPGRKALRGRNGPVTDTQCANLGLYKPLAAVL
jgi:hypothetical protein